MGGILVLTHIYVHTRTYRCMLLYIFILMHMKGLDGGVDSRSHILGSWRNLKVTTGNYTQTQLEGYGQQCTRTAYQGEPKKI